MCAFNHYDKVLNLLWCRAEEGEKHNKTSFYSTFACILLKTLESSLDCKEIELAHPKGDQSWVFTGRTDVEAETPILWPPDA